MFHEKTLHLLGMSSQPSPGLLDQIEQTEAGLGIKLPASVRAWYQLPGALRIVSGGSNNDQAIPLEKFELDPFGVDEFLRDELANDSPDLRRLLPIKLENQGVCCWSILLDESDDPPVMVEVDRDGKVVCHAATFSEFVYTCAWDDVCVFQAPYLLQANGVETSPATLTQLRQHFAKEITTAGWPAAKQFRYGGENVAILIWGPKNADWLVGAKRVEALGPHSD